MTFQRVTWTIACLFVLAAVAVPVSADDPSGDGGSNNGNGNGGDKSKGNGNGNGKGGGEGSSQGGDSSSGNGNNKGGGNDARGGKGESAESSGGQAKSDGRSKAEGHETNAGAAGSSDDGGATTDGSVTEADAESSAGPTDSSSGSGGTGGVFGFLKDDAESGGSPIHFLKDRTDMAELLSTDMSSPVVSTGMILLTIGTLVGVFGAVRTDRFKRPRPDARTLEEAARHEKAAVAAGLPEAHWAGLEASSYNRLLRMDPHTVAFWMGSELAAVCRWQVGRTLEDDMKDGSAVPHRRAGEDWSVPKVAKGRFVADPDALPTHVSTDDS